MRERLRNNARTWYSGRSGEVKARSGNHAGNTRIRAQEATSARGSKVYKGTVVEESAAPESLN